MDKNKSEILLALHERSWENFHERRRHEYKISIAVWSLYALSIGQLLSSSIKPDPTIQVGVLVVSVLILLLYIRWILGLARANLTDRRLAFFYSAELQESAGISLPEVLKESLMSHTQQFSVIRTGLNWNHSAEIGVTFALAAVVIFLVNLS